MTKNNGFSTNLCLLWLLSWVCGFSSSLCKIQLIPISQKIISLGLVAVLGCLIMKLSCNPSLTSSLSMYTNICLKSDQFDVKYGLISLGLVYSLFYLITDKTYRMLNMVKYISSISRFTEIQL